MLKRTNVLEQIYNKNFEEQTFVLFFLNK